MRDNVAVGAMFGARGRERTARQARDRAGEILTRVGLGHRITHRASDLTIPDLKRLELAKALAMDPELLFLDEVMAGLNPSEVEKAMELLRQIGREGVTLFVIEHVMRAIMGISDRLIVLHYGKKIAEGKPQEIVESPAVIEAYLGERFAKRARAAGREDALTAGGEFRKPACGALHGERCWKSRISLRATATCRSSGMCRSRCAAARSWPWSARTEPVRRRCSARFRSSCGRDRDRSASRDAT